MHKLLLTLTATAALAALALAGPTKGTPSVEPAFVPDGYVTVAFGKVRQQDGTWKDIKGLRLPYRITPIVARDLSKPHQVFPPRGDQNALTTWLRSLTPGGGKSGPQEDTPIYNADSGIYGTFPDNPSTLDDIGLPASAVNRPWSTLTFGFADNRASFSNFLIRWRVWTQRITATAPANSFAGEVADFGVIWNQVPPGPIAKVEILVSAAGVFAPTQNIYMATQFRDASNLQGEGDFEPEIDMVFSTGAPPSIGTSENQFWYDWDPRNGLYNDNEIDTFEDPNFANILTVIKSNQSSNATTLSPGSWTQSFGETISGDLFSIQNENDGDQIIARPLFNGSRNDPLVSWDLEAQVPTGTITALRMKVDSTATTGPFTHRVFLWNFVLNSWIQIDTRSVDQNNPAVVDVAYGGLLPITQFVNAQRRVRARVGFFRQPVPYPRGWTVGLDRVSFIVVRTTP